jgi:uncharacterized surface protein with fasciclin (FAS1) repeats
MTKTSLLLVSTSIMLLLSGCATTQTVPKTVAETAASTPELATLNKLISTAGLADTLKGPGPFTVFAPTDEAFKAVPAKTMEALAKDPALLKSVLSYHVIPSKLAAADIKNGAAKTIQGTNVALSKSGAFVTVEDAVVTTADVNASNGVVHIIDRVLVPPTK